MSAMTDKWKNELASKSYDLYEDEKKQEVKPVIERICPYIWHPVVKHLMMTIESMMTEPEELKKIIAGKSIASSEKKEMIKKAIKNVYPLRWDTGTTQPADYSTKHFITEDLSIMNSIKTNEGKTIQQRERIDPDKIEALVSKSLNLTYRETSTATGVIQQNPILLKAYSTVYYFNDSDLGNTGSGNIVDALHDTNSEPDMYSVYRDRGKIVEAYNYFCRDILTRQLEKDDDDDDDDTSSSGDKSHFSEYWYGDDEYQSGFDDGADLNNEDIYIGGFKKPSLIGGEISSWMISQHTELPVAFFYHVVGGDKNKKTQSIAMDILSKFKSAEWYSILGYDNLKGENFENIINYLWSVGQSPTQQKIKKIGTKTPTVTVESGRKTTKKKQKKTQYFKKEEVEKLIKLPIQQNLLSQALEYSKNTIFKEPVEILNSKIQDKNLLSNIKVVKSGSDNLEKFPFLDLEYYLVQTIKNNLESYKTKDDNVKALQESMRKMSIKASGGGGGTSSRGRGRRRRAIITSQKKGGPSRNFKFAASEYFDCDLTENPTSPTSLDQINPSNSFVMEFIRANSPSFQAAKTKENSNNPCFVSILALKKCKNRGHSNFFSVTSCMQEHHWASASQK